MNTKKLITLAEVKNRTGLGHSKIYEDMGKGKFPNRLKVGARSLWVEAEINAWIDERIAERESAA